VPPRGVIRRNIFLRCLRRSFPSSPAFSVRRRNSKVLLLYLAELAPAHILIGFRRIGVFFALSQKRNSSKVRSYLDSVFGLMNRVSFVRIEE
jgi:hypothetical protein